MVPPTPGYCEDSMKLLGPAGNADFPAHSSRPNKLRGRRGVNKPFRGSCCFPQLDTQGFRMQTPFGQDVGWSDHCWTQSAGTARGILQTLISGHSVNPCEWRRRGRTEIREPGVCCPRTARRLSHADPQGVLSAGTAVLAHPPCSPSSQQCPLGHTL